MGTTLAYGVVLGLFAQMYGPEITGAFAGGCKARGLSPVGCCRHQGAFLIQDGWSNLKIKGCANKVHSIGVRSGRS